MTRGSKLTVFLPWPGILKKLLVFYEYITAMHISTSQNFRRTEGLTFSAFHDRCIEQSDSVPTCKQDASDCEENSPEYTYQRNETVFLLENSTESFRKRFKAKSYISTA